MATGHHSVLTHKADSAEHGEHSDLLEQLLGNNQFVQAIEAYTQDNAEFDIPFLGGSNDAGDTVYFDRRFVEAIESGRVLYDGEPFDPRPFLHVHEAVEGAAIRVLGAEYDTPNDDGLPGAHLIATWAEHRAVDEGGLDWAKYQSALRPWIRKAEAADVGKAPPDLIELPYRGTPQGRKVSQASVGPALSGGSRNPSEPSGPEVPPGGEQSLRGGEGLQAAQKLTQAEAEYSQAKTGGDRCGDCEHYQPGRPPHCEVTEDPMRFGPQGWCNRFEAKDADDIAESPGGYVANPKRHALAMASAASLHNSGHISAGIRKLIEGKAKAGLAHGKIKKMMTFGSLAPDVEKEEG